MCKTAVAATLITILAGIACRVAAETISIPNNSFESPSTSFVDTRIDSWQKTPKPVWYDEAANGPWDQLCGLFINTPPGSVDSIVNCDGNQAIFLFAIPQVGLFQDYDSLDWAHQSPTHAFNTKYDVGKSYELTVGVIGGGFNMLEGVSMLIGLYYRDSASNAVPVASTNVVFSKSAFPNTTNLIDCTAYLPQVKPSDPWAGQNIGVQIMSTVTPDRVGGYWDLDNVRLTATAPIAFSIAAEKLGTDVRLSWPSVTGWQYQLKSSPDLKSWSNLDTPVAGTGEALSKLIPIAAASNAFFDVVATPKP